MRRPFESSFFTYPIQYIDSYLCIVSEAIESGFHAKAKKG